MKRFSNCLVIILTLPLQTLHAAYQSMPVKTRQVIIENGARRCEVLRPLQNFRVELVSDSGEIKSETYKDGRPFVAAQPGERYAIRLYNPLPVRVAVNLTVDGINAISGKPSGISDGEKWLISPYSSITIRGWQVNGAEARRFFFTEKPKSYAKWRGDKLGKDLAANCGVIGAAYFWSQKELDAYYDANPQYRYARAQGVNGALGYSPASEPSGNDYWQGTQLYNEGRLGEAFESFENAIQRQQNSKESEAYLRQIRQEIVSNAKKRPEEKAATGMGERESNLTQRVDFDYDTGMYRLSQAIVIYYDFASVPVPDPFPAISYAPEMP